MPPAGLERQAAGVEHHALADERERLAACAGRRVRRASGTAGACSEPWPTPSTPPSFCAFELRDVEHLTVTPRAAQQLARLPRPCRPATSPSTGVFTRSRAHDDRVARSPRRARPRRFTARAAVADDDAPSSSFDGVAVALVLEELVARRAPALGDRLRGVGERRAPVPTRRASVVATDATLLARRAIAAAGAAHAVERELVGLADADEHRGLGLQLARRSAPRASRPACPRSRPRRGTRRARRRARRRPTSAPGPSSRALARSGTASRSAATRSAAVVDDGEREGHGGSGGSRDRVSGIGSGSVRTGRNVPFLPAGERVHEIGEPVEVRHDLAVGRASRACAAATACRSARRTTVRATSSAAATRFSPGQHELGGRLVARGDVVDDRLERVDHLVGGERDAGRRACARFSGAVASSAPTTNSSRCSRTRSSSSSEPRSASARASPSAETASSTAPYASGPGESLPTRPP